MPGFCIQLGLWQLTAAGSLAIERNSLGGLKRSRALGTRGTEASMEFGEAGHSSQSDGSRL